MSMLSAQCDELRAMAESVGLAMPQAATLMMGAADAIERLGGENAKLRELVADMWQVLDGCFPVDCMWHCPRFDEHCCNSANDTCRFNDCMRELGIEVGE